MGWANCGKDSKGRPIGYAHEATCDQDGCDRGVDRGLDHVCGGMHGDDDGSCELYFCSDHLWLFKDGKFRCARCWEAFYGFDPINPTNQPAHAAKE